jgi:hypothetical protein
VTEADAKALYALNSDQKILNAESNVDLVKIFKDPKLANINKKNNAATFEQEAERLDELLIESQKNKLKNDKRFIQELTQEVIDSRKFKMSNISTSKIC